MDQSSLSIRTLASALPDFAFGAVFLITWIAPAAIEEKMVAYLMLVMLMEFLNVHSSAFMGNVIIGDTPKPKKALALLGLGVFYTIFVGWFSLGFQTWWPLWAFLGMTANRLAGVLFAAAPTGEEKTFVQSHWAMSVALYLLFVIFTTIVPMPEFGITKEVVSAQELPGEGLWIDEPERVIAFGFFYFTGTGIAEVLWEKWGRKEANAKEESQK